MDLSRLVTDGQSLSKKWDINSLSKVPFGNKRTKDLMFFTIKVNEDSVKYTTEALAMVFPVGIRGLREGLKKQADKIINIAYKYTPTSHGKPWENKYNRPGNLRESIYWYSGDGTRRFVNSFVERKNNKWQQQAKGKVTPYERKGMPTVSISYRANYLEPVHELHRTKAYFLYRALERASKNVRSTVGKEIQKSIRSLEVPKGTVHQTKATLRGNTPWEKNIFRKIHKRAYGAGLKQIRREII